MRIWTMDVEKNIEAAIEFSNFLNKNNIRGEFYICGTLVEKYPEKCIILAKNHVVGGHGYEHENFVKLKPREYRRGTTITIFMNNKAGNKKYINDLSFLRLFVKRFDNSIPLFSSISISFLKLKIVLTLT